MAIPVFVSQVVAATTDTVQVGAGSVQTLSPLRYYYLISPRSAATNGQSMMIALKALADASSAVVWTFVLTSDLKLKVTHDNVGSQNLILNRGLAWNLGFAINAYPPDLSLTGTYAVPAGAGGYTAGYRSPWLWCPERWVSMTGPQLFDTAVSPGIRSSAGSSARAPDGTGSYTSNGEQIDAQFMFTGVEYLYRAKQPNLTYGHAHEREDHETWWQLGPKLGRRFLFWRDKTGLVGSAAPSGSGTISPAYVEYNPDDATRATPRCEATAPPLLTLWNITVGGFTTENGISEFL